MLVFFDVLLLPSKTFGVLTEKQSDYFAPMDVLPSKGLFRNKWLGAGVTVVISSAPNVCHGRKGGLSVPPPPEFCKPL